LTFIDFSSDSRIFSWKNENKSSEEMREARNETMESVNEELGMKKSKNNFTYRLIKHVDIFHESFTTVGKSKK
jgi:hypothetical protein